MAMGLLFNPFVLEIKWWHPEDIQSGLVTHLLAPSFGQNDNGKDFIVYSCVPEIL